MTSARQLELPGTDQHQRTARRVVRCPLATRCGLCLGPLAMGDLVEVAHGEHVHVACQAAADRMHR